VLDEAVVQTLSRLTFARAVAGGRGGAGYLASVERGSAGPVESEPAATVPSVTARID
jgi:hypothetical protein